MSAIITIIGITAITITKIVTMIVTVALTSVPGEELSWSDTVSM